MQLFDTHCHIHDVEFFNPEDAEAAFNRAIENGVETILCVGTSLEDSKRAISFAAAHPEHCRASIGIHPHEASKFTTEQIDNQLAELAELADKTEVVAVGECGFDFYYNDRAQVLGLQEQLLKGQIEIASKHNLPMSFHVREAFEDFWRVLEDYQGVKGVLHSFTDKPSHLKKALSNGLLIGINGIATFTTHKWQLDLLKSLELTTFVLETDAPFLTPTPLRGNINSPENVIYITKFLADLRGEGEDQIAKATTANAKKLFNL